MVRDRWSVLLFVAAGLFGGSTAALSGQQLVYDEANRVFTLTYLDDDGVQRSVQIIPPNRVDPALDAVISDPGSGMLEYSYTFGNSAPATDQSIWAVEFDCPPLGKTVTMSAPPDWHPSHRVTFRDGSSPVCRLIAPTGSGEIQPGTTRAGFEVNSEFLPGIASAAVWGKLDSLVTLPGLFEAGPELALLRGQAQGIFGGWFETTTVGPARDPAEVGGSAGVALLIDDLDAVCALGWIDDGGVCNSLRVKLVQAQASIVADRPAARQQLQAFLNELDAQRGQHVNENAYWLLRTLAEHVITTI